eukprot:TRINITY_DN22863_c0_g1_i1.p1 TRINITY_DN22863_c0_g1~~TRINITY_DN22863_c0_g1_i1.p1  ORF type:complete len:133 (-),score=10.48 TRINITY_DN22863_c0_g1_i1:818-1216(-)
MGFVAPKVYTLDYFQLTQPTLPCQGVVVLFPKLNEDPKEKRQEWLYSVLGNSVNGNRHVSTVESIFFCTSGDAICLMVSPEAAQSATGKSPYKLDLEDVHVEPWSETTKTKLQFRAPYQVILMQDRRREREE